MKEKFDLRTLEGSKRIFRISVAAVILFSFFAICLPAIGGV